MTASKQQSLIRVIGLQGIEDQVIVDLNQLHQLNEKLQPDLQQCIQQVVVIFQLRISRGHSCTAIYTSLSYRLL